MDKTKVVGFDNQGKNAMQCFVFSLGKLLLKLKMHASKKFETACVLDRIFGTNFGMSVLYFSVLLLPYFAFSSSSISHSLLFLLCTTNLEDQKKRGKSQSCIE